MKFSYVCQVSEWFHTESSQKYLGSVEKILGLARVGSVVKKCRIGLNEIIKVRFGRISSTQGRMPALAEGWNKSSLRVESRM